jgi:DNA (cytosine-5)-methyltransferase 1
MNKQLTFFDLFSGIGGFKIGLERAGFKSIGFCDNDKYANMLYKAYFKNDKELFFEDVQSINTQELPDFDILCAGFPCQSFQLQEKDVDLKTQEAQCFLKSLGFSKTNDPDILFSKMSKAYLIMNPEKLSKPYLKFSPTLGIKLNGSYLILSSSQFLKIGNASTLLDVLETNVPEKYFLSQTQVQRILALAKNKTSSIGKTVKKNGSMKKNQKSEQ